MSMGDCGKSCIFAKVNHSLGLFRTIYPKTNFWKTNSNPQNILKKKMHIFYSERCTSFGMKDVHLWGKKSLIKKFFIRTFWIYSLIRKNYSLYIFHYNWLFKIKSWFSYIKLGYLPVVRDFRLPHSYRNKILPFAKDTKDFNILKLFKLL